MNKKLSILITGLMIILLGCEKFVEPDLPATKISAEVVYTNNSTSAAVLTRIYDRMRVFVDVNGISILTALSADELQNITIQDENQLRFYKNALMSTSVPFWSEFYSQIYAVNDVLESLPDAANVTPAVKNQLLGEAKFIRAFSYFYLVNIFGDVPLITQTNYAINRVAVRASVQDIYSQIISDLKDAKSLMNAKYVTSDAVTVTQEKVRPNKMVATALLARAYLYGGYFPEAENESSILINNTDYRLEDLSKVFLKNNAEVIWFIESRIGRNTAEGIFYGIVDEPNAQHPVTISNALLKAFEPGDLRKTNWLNTKVKLDPGTGNVQASYTYPYKYKINLSDQPVTESPIVFRLAEQYLIRAEARAMQRKLIGDNSAQTDLNAIRARAGLLLTDATSLQAMLTAIAQERRVELFTEWGDRWFNLKRTKLVDEVMSVAAVIKETTWNSNWALYPIPTREIQTNPSLTGKQNPGYQ